MRLIARVVLGTGWLMFAVMARAAIPGAPLITIVEAERLVAVEVTADSAGDDAELVNATAGPFVDMLDLDATGELGSSGRSEARQKTQISSFSVRGTGWVVGETSLGNSDQAVVEAYASSWVNLRFEIPVDAQYSLSGSLATAGFANGQCLGWTGVTLSGQRPDGLPFSDSASFNCSSDPADKDFFFTGIAKANATLTLNVNAQAATSGEERWNFLGTGTASFDFVLDFGDRDGDGLLDVWEEDEGIDFPGAGLEIDLAGADPDRKDLFVEIDSMQFVAIDPEALDMVADAFAHAPADLIDNPDGSAGINLHLVHDDGDLIPFTPIEGSDAEIKSQALAIKSAYFGSPQNRAHPESNDILEVRNFVFRYCMWVDTLVDEIGDMGGLGEIPGNDFLVAAGFLRDKGLNRATDWIAATLMHELGHTLGLRHGGNDNINRKPNYLSVMNYIYGYPFDKETPEGTNIQVIWRLAFSHFPLATINENELNEAAPLLGPLGRRIMFNSAAPTDPDPTVLTLAWAWEPRVDWNNDGTVPDPDTYQQDINRFQNAAPVNYQTLTSYSDWDRIWYQMSGHQNFDRAAAPEVMNLERDLEMEFFDALLSEDFVDQTAGSAMIFADDFDLGTTTAWSVTNP